MAFARSAATAALRSNVCTSVRRLTATRSYVQPLLKPRFTPVRWHSASGSLSKVYDFSTIKDLSEKPSAERILIDVREPSEYEAGYIPTAINLPIKSQPDALFLPEEEFEDRFGFEKPATDKEVVFYCKSGVRSSAAAQLAQQHGYTNVAEYRGSWLDWTKNGGTASKP
ncbi:Thiosulfate sulfurtransferase RDL2, mitochondrial [Pseudocercospora fuligena]|uniref:Thiosulfate sulfurtransferase RDL2, mitochondrial n=1 Tax=Pseudocercospora fuligena TaxID=685502 RepID=A0A8H6VG30_9PEZI|nr:Thiosulfate sulfurtransferase RDL2, mitochondrial [Pseudocercospora fuligena]